MNTMEHSCEAGIRPHLAATRCVRGHGFELITALFPWAKCKVIFGKFPCPQLTLSCLSNFEKEGSA